MLLVLLALCNRTEQPEYWKVKATLYNKFMNVSWARLIGNKPRLGQN